MPKHTLSILPITSLQARTFELIFRVFYMIEVTFLLIHPDLFVRNKSVVFDFGLLQYGKVRSVRRIIKFYDSLWGSS